MSSLPTFCPPTGICPVNRNSIDYLLSQNGTGNAVIIVVGGAAESLQCTPGLNSVTLKNRKGFVRLALRKGWVGCAFSDTSTCGFHWPAQYVVEWENVIPWAAAPHGNNKILDYYTQKGHMLAKRAAKSFYECAVLSLLSSSWHIVHFQGLGSLSSPLGYALMRQTAAWRALGWSHQPKQAHSFTNTAEDYHISGCTLSKEA